MERTAASVTAAAPVGRDREVARLDALLDATRHGRGGALVVSGDPGIGKTHLLETTIARHDGFTVLTARGVESEGELPFAGLFDLLRPLTEADLTRSAAGLAEPERALLDRLRSGAPASVERFAVSTLVLRLLCALAEHRQVLVVVDDVQWLDPASLDAVAFAARRIHHDAVAVVLAVRPGDDRGALRGLDEVELTGLERSAATDLLRARSRHPVPETVAERVVSMSAGNPLAVIELARGVGRAGAGEAWEPRLRSVPELFRDRVRELDDGARTAAVVLALDTEERSASVWTAAAELDVGVAEFERLELASLVTFRDGAPCLVHPMVRSAVTAEVAPPLLRAGHRAWATALAASGSGAAARAWHLAAATVGQDPEAAAALDDAGTRAVAVSAYGTASVTLERAARMSTEAGARGDRLLRAGEAARFAGRPDDAARLLHEAAAVATGSRLASAIDAERGRGHLYHGRITEARRLVLRAADTLADTEPGAAARMLGVAAWSAMITSEHPRAIELARRARDLARRAGAPPSPLVELTLGTSLFSVGEITESYPLLAAACSDVEARVESVDPEFACFAGVCLAWVGEFGRARALLSVMIERARSASAFGVLVAALHAQAYVDARTGALTRALAAAQEAVAIAGTTDNRLWRYFSLGCLAHVEAALGREPECRAHADEALELARTMDIDHPAPVREALGHLELARGDPDAAIRQLEAVNRGGTGGDLVLGRPTALDLVEAHVRAGRELSPELAAQVAALSTDDRFPGLAAVCWRVRGLLAPDDEVDACFGRATALHEVSENPLAAARTLLCHGERLRRAGHRAKARDRLAAAHDRFEHLGAHLWAARVDAELRAAGGTPRADRPPSGVEALTPQELQVALAVGRDLTNRQVAAELYLSPRTVEFHLGHVYRKLSIRSRAGLVAALADVVTAGAAVPVQARPARTGAPVAVAG